MNTFGVVWHLLHGGTACAFVSGNVVGCVKRPFVHSVGVWHISHVVGKPAAA